VEQLAMEVVQVMLMVDDLAELMTLVVEVEVEMD
jgi:hypothetical protein